jgi:putative heme iron utilization protein
MDEKIRKDKVMMKVKTVLPSKPEKHQGHKTKYFRKDLINHTHAGNASLMTLVTKTFENTNTSARYK